jgi:hypothetical protein
MTIGPVEYMILGFPDGYLSDEIGDELAWLSTTSVIRLLDFVLLTKEVSGEVSVAELDELDQMVGFADIDGQLGGLIGQQDIEFVSARLDPGSSAALLLVEDLWATSLSDALDRSGAFLVEGARIPKDLVDAALSTLPAA